MAIDSSKLFAFLKTIYCVEINLNVDGFYMEIPLSQIAQESLNCLLLSLGKQTQDRTRVRLSYQVTAIDHKLLDSGIPTVSDLKVFLQTTLY